MLGPLGSTLMSIMRVLTPSEIERYAHEVVSAEEAKVMSIAAGAEGYEMLSDSHLEHGSGGHKAKIIPINEAAEKELKELEEPDLEKPKKQAKKSDNSLGSLGILSAGELNEQEAKKKKLNDSKKESTSIFILNQRERLKKSQNKLAGQAAILEYKKSASQEMIQSDNTHDDEEKVSGSSGILINKKHY